MTSNNDDLKAAEEYVKTHVKYADEEGRLSQFLGELKANPEFFPEAETCDGCASDTIAVYQAYLAGLEAGREDRFEVANIMPVECSCCTEKYLADVNREMSRCPMCDTLMVLAPKGPEGES